MLSFLLDIGDKLVIVVPGINRETGKVVYFVFVELDELVGRELIFEGNPKWDQGGDFLIVKNKPPQISRSKVRQIAALIESRLL